VTGESLPDPAPATFEPEYLIASLAISLDRALEFTKHCGDLAPELQTAADSLAQRQRHLFRTTRRAILRRSSGSS
jgi:hypothetical protein